jgi:hypothetical protein
MYKSHLASDSHSCSCEFDLLATLSRTPSYTASYCTPNYPPHDVNQQFSHKGWGALLTAFPQKLYSAFIILNHATTASLVSQVHYPSIGSLPSQARHSYATISSHTSISTIPYLSYQAITSLTLMSHSWHNYACPCCGILLYPSPRASSLLLLI